MSRARALLLALALALAACPGSGGAPKDKSLVDVCTESGQRCRMGGSRIGLCGEMADGKLTCVSQH